MSEEIEKAFKGQAPGYSKHVGYTRYVNGKAIRVEGGAQPHQKVTLAAPGSVKHKGGEFLDRLHSYVHKKAPTTEHELQEAVHRFVHSKFEGDEKALSKFHAEGMKELSRHGLVTHHEFKKKPDTGKVKFRPDSEVTRGTRGKPSRHEEQEAHYVTQASEAKADRKEARKLGITLEELYGKRHLTWMREQEAKKKPRKEASHPADQELAERKKQLANAPSKRELGSTKRVIEEQRKNAAANSRIDKIPVKTPAVEKPKATEPEKALPKIPSFEDASHKRLSKLAEHPKAKKKAIAALAERIASKPEDATHADLHAEISALEQRHGIEPETDPTKIGYHEPAVQKVIKKFSNAKDLLAATHAPGFGGSSSPPHVKANAYEAARRLNEGQKATPAPAQPAAKPASKAEEKPATSAAAPKIGKFDEGSVRYLVDHMSESELRSRLPQASDSIKNNVNEALRRIAEKKEEKTS